MLAEPKVKHFGIAGAGLISLRLMLGLTPTMGHVVQREHPQN